MGCVQSEAALWHAFSPWSRWKGWVFRAFGSIELIFDVKIAYSPFALLKCKCCAGLISTLYIECAAKNIHVHRAGVSEINEEE